MSGDVLGQTSDGDSDFHEPQTRNLKAADLVITGALVETKLYLYGKVSCNQLSTCFYKRANLCHAVLIRNVRRLLTNH